MDKRLHADAIPRSKLHLGRERRWSDPSGMPWQAVVGAAELTGPQDQNIDIENMKMHITAVASGDDNKNGPAPCRDGWSGMPATEKAARRNTRTLSIPTKATMVSPTTPKLASRSNHANAVTKPL
jgi:hypothetical protein